MDKQQKQEQMLMKRINKNMKAKKNLNHKMKQNSSKVQDKLNKDFQQTVKDAILAEKLSKNSSEIDYSYLKLVRYKVVTVQRILKQFNDIKMQENLHQLVKNIIENNQPMTLQEFEKKYLK